MLTTYIAIGLGGALGALSRFGLGRLLPATAFTHFPLQIFLVNAIGCLMMGVVLESMAFYGALSAPMRSFLTTGFLGGFTTFSAFALEFGLLVDKDLPAHAIFYAVSSVMVSLFCFFIGIRAVRLVALG
ncbi:MAG: fluoride efflux transporter CrcB [Alphaproteobacteria bacterium]|jgi:CrcB protein|nr:fluoride efflux transporter CrcB [Alphaproteobacteria bacterium]